MSITDRIIFVVFVLLFAILLVDLNTNYGNRLWEEWTGRHDRYSVIQNKKIGYVNGRGRIVIKPRFAKGADYFHTDPSPAVPFGRRGQPSRLWGYIDGYGHFVIAPAYHWASSFSEGLAAVGMEIPKSKGVFRFGYIDLQGRPVVDITLHEAQPFSEGFAGARMNKHWGFLNKKGEWSIPPQFDQVKPFSEGLAAVRVGRRWGFINSVSRFVIPAEFDSVKSFSQELAAVSMGGKWGYINRIGETVIPLSMISAGSFSEGLAPVQTAEGLAYINRLGEVAIQGRKFSQLRPFKEGIAPVKLGRGAPEGRKGKWGYISRDNRWIAEPQFDWAFPFEGGLARVGLKTTDERRGYLNREGRLVWDPAHWHQEYNTRLTILNAMIAAIGLYILALLRYNLLKFRSRMRGSRVDQSLLSSGL